MKTHTYADCATNYQLWEEFVDPDGVDSEEFFDSLTVEQKVTMQIVMFGPRSMNLSRPPKRTTWDNYK